jgi:hypothetical protein
MGSPRLPRAFQNLPLRKRAKHAMLVDTSNEADKANVENGFKHAGVAPEVGGMKLFSRIRQ